MDARIIFRSSYLLEERSYKVIIPNEKKKDFFFSMVDATMCILIFTIFVSSSISWIDCSCSDRVSKFSFDSELEGRDNESRFMAPSRTKQKTFPLLMLE